MQIPHEIHLKVAKRILHYVRGIVQFRIHYSSGGTPLLVGFTNSYWAGVVYLKNHHKKKKLFVHLSLKGFEISGK
jgi:hypothetical protein